VAARAAAYTPTHLAEKILQSRSAIEGERRQVTVLFADLAGFTALAEQLDPEEFISSSTTVEFHRLDRTAGGVARRAQARH
jgi:class 3 adenylate cyclase